MDIHFGMSIIGHSIHVYKRKIFEGNIENVYSIQGNKTINPTTKGNKTVQQNDINWSYLILGNEALTHIKVKTIMHDFSPKHNP